MVLHLVRAHAQKLVLTAASITTSFAPVGSALLPEELLQAPGHLLAPCLPSGHLSKLVVNRHEGPFSGRAR